MSATRSFSLSSVKITAALLSYVIVRVHRRLSERTGKPRQMAYTAAKWWCIYTGNLNPFFHPCKRHGKAARGLLNASNGPFLSTSKQCVTERGGSA